MRHAFGIDAHHFAIQRRGVRVAELGQITADFRFRMDAAHQTPHQLQHGGIGDDQRTVALFGREPANLGPLAESSSSAKRSVGMKRISLFCTVGTTARSRSLRITP